MPRCFIRIDIAHFIKHITKWSSFVNTSKRVKEIYLRTICLIIKTQSLDEIRSLLISIFIVASNKSDGDNTVTGSITQCEMHKTKILEVVSSGLTNVQFNELLLSSENMEVETAFNTEKGLEDTMNPFISWANNIYEESQNHIEEGIGINPLYLPSIIPLLKKKK